MTALVFRRSMNGRGALPYREWLQDLDRPIVLFALDRESDDDCFAHVEYFDSFDHPTPVERRAVELSGRHQFTQIFAQSEHDLLRAAALRLTLRLPGQSPESALAFRDKLRMKALVRAAGIETAEYAPLESPNQLRAFIRRNGLPCVVKPRTGAGSRGVRVLQSPNDAERLLEGALPDHHLVERFINAPTFHVDGLMTDGVVLFISASRYLNNCISFQTGASHGSALLDPADATSAALVATTEQVLDALPAAPHLAFHAEFFVDGDNRIVFCEIAARPGGSRTADPMLAGYGIDMYQQWVRRSFGLPVELPPARPWSCAGRLLVPPKRGRLVAAPTSTPFDWVVDYRLHSQVGQRWEAPVSSGTNVATFVITGVDTNHTDARMRELDTWFRRQVEWRCD